MRVAADFTGPSERRGRGWPVGRGGYDRSGRASPWPEAGLCLLSL